jgi:hypothetical protein
VAPGTEHGVQPRKCKLTATTGYEMSNLVDSEPADNRKGSGGQPQGSPSLWA